MTSELRPAVDVIEAIREILTTSTLLRADKNCNSSMQAIMWDQRATAVIEADREAARAAQAAELAKYKAMAEALAGALGDIRDGCGQCGGYGTYPEEETVTGKVLWWDCSSPQCHHARAALGSAKI